MSSNITQIPANIQNNYLIVNNPKYGFEIKISIQEIYKNIFELIIGHQHVCNDTYNIKYSIDTDDYIKQNTFYNKLCVSYGIEYTLIDINELVNSMINPKTYLPYKLENKINKLLLKNLSIGPNCYIHNDIFCIDSSHLYNSKYLKKDLENLIKIPLKFIREAFEFYYENTHDHKMIFINTIIYKGKKYYLYIYAQSSWYIYGFNLYTQQINSDITHNNAVDKLFYNFICGKYELKFVYNNYKIAKEYQIIKIFDEYFFDKLNNYLTGCIYSYILGFNHILIQ